MTTWITFFQLIMHAQENFPYLCRESNIVRQSPSMIRCWIFNFYCSLTLPRKLHFPLFHSRSYVLFVQGRFQQNLIASASLSHLVHPQKGCSFRPFVLVSCVQRVDYGIPSSCLGFVFHSTDAHKHAFKVLSFSNRGLEIK